MRRARRPWRIVLIVEDESDGKALRHLAQKAGIGAIVDWLPAAGIGNIKRRAEALIRLARDRVEGRGCLLSEDAAPLSATTRSATHRPAGDWPGPSTQRLARRDNWPPGRVSDRRPTIVVKAGPCWRLAASPAGRLAS